MKRLAAVAALSLALTGLAAPAMAAEPVPSRQLSQLNDAPVDPSPNHHKIKAPPLGKSDWATLLSGGYNDEAAAATDAESAAAPYVSSHSAPVLIKAGLVVAKVAKAKALKQPKQQKQPKTAKQAKPAKQPKAAAQPKQTATKPAAQPKTTKAAKVKPPPLTAQQAQAQSFANPPRVRPRKHP